MPTPNLLLIGAINAHLFDYRTIIGGIIIASQGRLSKNGAIIDQLPAATQWKAGGSTAGRDSAKAATTAAAYASIR
jgi:hypothetical protein